MSQGEYLDTVSDLKHIRIDRVMIGLAFNGAPVLLFDVSKPPSAFIKTLMDAYREITGDTEHEPFSIGGATYARFLPESVSFGPLFPYEMELAHEANECLSVESLTGMTEIYILALEKLVRL